MGIREAQLRKSSGTQRPVLEMWSADLTTGELWLSPIDILQGVSKVCSDLFCSNVSLFNSPTLKIRCIFSCLFFIQSFKLLVTRMPAFISMTFSKRPGIECASSFSVSRVTFFHAKRSRLFSAFIVLGAESLHVVTLPMFSMGLRSGEFAGQPSFA